MAKRRVIVESDSEDSAGAPKRARTDEYSEAPSSQAREKTRLNGKGKERARQNEDGESDAEFNMQHTGVDDEKYEEMHQEQIRAAVESKRKIAGGIADHGIIEAIEMHQFMCHKYLTFSFGPQINFIIGHNGSGKSAVLSAITVALGGKANSTGRGSGLKAFIREGQPASEVTIQIKNQGEEAYKPKEYGKSIVITRKFTKEGSSSWKIKSRDGKVISTKKEELSAICDHMNIQVDNPMNVLTQDAARQFLSASHPTDKYKFFLRGTQLSQLSEEYTTCLENIEHTTKVLNSKKAVLPDLRAACKEAMARFQEATKARDQKKKVNELKKELAWSFVHDKEAEMTKAVEHAAKTGRRIPKIENNLKEAQARFEAETASVAQCDEEFHALGNMNHLADQKKELTENMRNNRSLLNELTSERKQMETTFKAAKESIALIQKQIDDEARRMEADTQTKREESSRHLEHARISLQEAEAALPALIETKDQIDAENRTTKEHGERASNDVQRMRDDIMRCDNMIRNCEMQEKNQYAAYGRDIPQVLDRIRRARWVGDQPVGPLGVHVKVRDPESWADLLRRQLGGMLTAFAVTDAQDLKPLKRILVESGNPHLLIFVAPRDIFDYSSGEPPAHMLTVLRALDISDPYVLRIMINQRSIERMFLAKTRREGEQVLREVNGGGQAWTADGYLLKRYPEGGESTSPLPKQRNDATNLLLSGRNSAAEKEHYIRERKRYEEEVKVYTQRVHDLKQKYMMGKRAYDAKLREEMQARQTISIARDRLHQLQEAAQEDMPANIAGLEASKKESEEEKENLEAQFKDHIARKAEIDEEQKSLLEQLNAVKRDMEEFESRQKKVQTKVEKAAEKRMEAQNSIKHYEAKLKGEQTKVDEANEAAKVLVEEFEAWTAKAADYCDRVETTRRSDEIQRNLDSVQHALKEREKRHGATVDEMTVEVNKTRANLEVAENQLKQMVSLNKRLKTSLVARLNRWQEFRLHIAVRCKLVFQYNLSHRGYFGKVLFDHDKGTLQLKVQTDDVAATQGSRDKDPRSLSGGEKSFSTICLLLSLWEAIGCPLRCLDEFDVFMDAVNRRISMKMMIETANQSDKKQYILITPQDMTSITAGQTVRVHRMLDPERNQGVLAFS
ncbi:P-loop containing nucleoside triphosphate hydrolase protein [Guyanagaster necrorhizus]|uniref:P-loop containing nucleoside triphosphate hydrolase protein n=1 Tax=Guyanagaster necrorhizus TaxID=856835 RepID=A0A9P7VNH0_9AGAR|nr:P-loop containing nucleoside triphosphate hydrolase protein [Guyanagaster necrorhizus MCA 3950]KAG7443126.1 P-loop containing nucleoside triphosphate hydrolase protein [Guyanagaster necrorhizus MCA 3950]